VRALVLLVAAAVAVAGYGAWHSRPRAVATPAILATGAPVTGLASPTAPAASTPPSSVPAPTAAVVAPPAAEVVVHVAGLVRRPGLVRLPAGSRVADAVTAAGGVTKPRAADSVNLARLLVDGEQIVVSTTPSMPSDQVSTVNPGAPMVLDLNTATAEALDTLPGVGPVLAARIISWRNENGPFRSVEELGEVSGIGEAILGQVRDLVRV
jgi:competence protein ComEA